ncbi:hypothetical protein SLEP1_g24603 [Rubroshorea leprosula]|uniref:Uncharacterized protein n=1 Tax=Rubroshorea leprosula TaxID=152421 RepID=A0AAV5JQQ2_9ROSI|nr:hypothetical protein SLEP1_g24603 [Rubroshorea leprosula]
MLAHVDILLIEPVCSSDPVSGGYTPANSVPVNGWFITLAMTYRVDVYFIPILYLFFVITLVSML